MKFTKMHGLGNDYLYVYGDVPENISELSQKLSERHFGAGSDGMIYISKSDIADFKICRFFLIFAVAYLSSVIDDRNYIRRENHV